MFPSVSKETKRYFLVTFVFMLVSNRLFFLFGHLIAHGFHHWDLSLPVDAQIPFLPWTVLIYNGVYLWWVYLYWQISQRDRKESDRFFCSLLLAKTVGFLFFLLFPTTISRPVPVGNSVWNFILRVTYQLDTPDNLFPSIHCVLGWICWLGVRGKKDIPVWMRVTAFLLAVAVCISTMTVRQHVLADVVGGVLLSEICYAFAGLPALRDLYTRLIDGLIAFVMSLGKKVRTT